MSKRSLIDSIEVKKACSENWDAMKGNERVRFCSHCALEVNDLSALTRKQAMRLVNESGGRICVRYVKNPIDNSPVFARKFHQITRRATLAAGVLSATLAVSTLAYAQNESLPVNKNPRSVLVEKTESDRPQEGGIAISFAGYIFDSNKALIPNATVTITNVKTNEMLWTTTNPEGFYKFENVPSARYKMTAAASGFKEGSVEMDVFDGEETGASLSLESGGEEIVTITMGEIAVISYSSQISTAVSQNDVEKLQSLIQRGENVNVKEKNYNNITPLFLAVENGNVEIAETLLNFGAKINIRDDNRQTPLMRLDEDADEELVNLLVKHGARVNLVDKERNTTLILAARSVKAEVLRILIKHGADIDARNNARRTALSEAADADNLENVRALLEAGADPHIKDEDGETAFTLTTDEEIKKLLESYGARQPEDSQ